MKYTVDGVTVIGWSCLVDAENEDEAMKKAEEYWEHNTNYESIEITGVYEGE